MTEDYPPPDRRKLITLSVMAATFMQSLDTTIANVALPHVQGGLSASSGEIIWVLTSYIVAAAIFTPMSGWLASRFGRKRVIQISIIGFTIASGLCGLATNIQQLVLFRLLQGVFGAALQPMSQAVLLDINPPERHGQAMAQWGISGMLAPIVGPALGGLLTEAFSWRWVFFINLPVGLLAFIGVTAFLKDKARAQPIRLDIFGFAMLALALASMQLILDRGQSLGWFDSLEVRLEAAAAVFFGYLFIVQTATVQNPFINPSLFADRNFLVATIFGFFVNIILFSVLALLPPMLAGLMGYPIVLVGLVTAPRGIGTLMSMLFVGRLLKRFDPRLLILAGFTLMAIAQYRMSGFALNMSGSLVVTSGLIQGVSVGLIFVPLTTMSFATLNPLFRNEGAAMYTLVRNMGSAVGVALLQSITIRNTGTVAARLAEGVRPDNPAFAYAFPDIDLGSALDVAKMKGMIARQAAMVAYVDAFYMLFIIAVLATPLLLLLRPPRRAGG